MASRKFEKGSESWKLFQDYWKFIQDYGQPEGDNTSYWDDMISAGASLAKKYGEKEYYIRLINDHIEEMGRVHNAKA